MPRFGAVLTAMVTPFTDDGSVDLAETAELARWLVDQGNDGLVVTGTTGESPTLSDDERIAVWRAVRDAVDVPLLAGSTSNDTGHSVRLTEAASDCGVDGILAVTPYYNRPSQAGIEAHFRAVAACTSRPVVLYDIPVRTGRKIATSTLLRLAAEVPNILGVKDASGNPGETARLVAETASDFEVYSGDDALLLPLLAIGAVGCIGVATHWSAGLHREMIHAFTKGDVEHARSVNARLLSSFAFETSDTTPNPMPSKAMLRTLGRPVGQCRLPIGPAPDELDARARALAAELGIAS